ncbi:hypothetical protein [Acetomicrobium sp.]
MKVTKMLLISSIKAAHVAVVPGIAFAYESRHAFSLCQITGSG